MKKYIFIAFALFLILVHPIFAGAGIVNITETGGYRRNPEILVFDFPNMSSCSALEVRDSDNLTVLPYFKSIQGASCRMYVKRNVTANSNFLLYITETGGTASTLASLTLLNETFNDGNAYDNSTGYNWTNSAFPTITIENGIANFTSPVSVFTYGHNDSSTTRLWNNYTLSARVKGGCDIFYFDGTQPPDSIDCNTKGAFMFSHLDEANYLATAQPQNYDYSIDTYSDIPTYRFFTRVNNVDVSQGDVNGNITQQQDIEEFYIWELSVNGSIVHARGYNNTGQTYEKYYANITGKSGTIGFENYDISNVSDTWDIKGFNVDFINVYPTENYKTGLMNFVVSSSSSPGPPPNIYPFPARTVLADTEVCNNICSSGPASFVYGFNASAGARNGNMTYILYDDPNVSSSLNVGALQTYYKINNTFFSGLIRNASFNFENLNVLGFPCSGVWAGNWNLFFLENDSWNENINYTERPVSSLFANLSYKAYPDTFFDSNINYSVPLSSRYTFGAQYLMNDLYNDVQTSFNIPDNQECAIRTMTSHQGGYGPFVNITYDADDYEEGSASSLDSISGDLFLDFESGNYSGSGSQTIFYDIFYDNIFNAIRANPNITIAPALLSTSPDNDLNTRISSCRTFSSYSTNPVTANVINGTYSYVCVNLSSQHRNESFFGIIKMIDNTNVAGGANIDPYFLWAISGPSYVIFSDPTYIPDPQLASENLTVVTTSSTQVFNTTMFFRVTQGSSVGPYTALFNTTSDLLTHRFVINNQYMVSPAYYELYFSGVSSIGENVNSSVYNFSIGVTQTPNVNATLPDAISNLGEGLGVDTQTATYLFGAIVLILGTGVALVYGGGLKMAIAVSIALTSTLVLIGFLPYYILIPIIVYVVAVIVKFISSIFGGSDSGD